MSLEEMWSQGVLGCRAQQMWFRMVLRTVLVLFLRAVLFHFNSSIKNMSL